MTYEEFYGMDYERFKEVLGFVLSSIETSSLYTIHNFKNQIAR